MLARKPVVVVAIVLVLLLAGGGVYFAWKNGSNKPVTKTTTTNQQPTTTGANPAPTPSSTPTTATQPATKPTTTAPKTTTPAGGQTNTGSGTQSGGGTPTPTCATSGQIGTYPTCYPAPPAPTASGKSWKLSWNEEFSGTDYNHSKLTPCFDWNYGDCTSSFNQGREHYQASQVRVSGGTAKLVAEPTSPPIADGACQNGSCTYLSGLLSTARPNAGNGSGYLYSFTYGYVEASLKLPATRGFFTAFWMLPTDTSYNYDTEIDILENLGYDNKTMFQTYHYNNRSQSYTPNTGVNNNGACPVTDLSGGFHKFGVDWQADHVAFYIDGTKCGQFNGNSSTIESGPMQIILDMMVDNNWQRSWSQGLADPTLVRQLEVDYMRVYQLQ